MSQKISPIARNTFRECVRSRAMFGVLFFAAFIVVVATLFGSVTIGDQHLVVMDFGLFAISLCTTFYAVLSGSTLLEKELTRRTIITVLSKAVSRGEFLVGKYLGILAATATLLICMTTALLLYVLALTGTMHWPLAQAALYIFLESTIVCALTIFFSAIAATPILAGCFTVAVFITGRSAEYILYFAKEGEPGRLLVQCLELLYRVVPHLHSLVVSDQVVQGVTLPISHLAWGAVYASAYSALLIVLSVIAFSRRNFT